VQTFEFIDPDLIPTIYIHENGEPKYRINDRDETIDPVFMINTQI